MATKQQLSVIHYITPLIDVSKSSVSVPLIIYSQVNKLYITNHLNSFLTNTLNLRQLYTFK